MPHEDTPDLPGTFPVPPRCEKAEEAGERLAAHARRLRLLLLHLAGTAVRRHVELDDLVQEVYLRALGDPRGLPRDEPDEGSSGTSRSAPLWRYLAHIARHTVIDAARSIRAAKRSGRTVPIAHSDWSRAGPRASQLLAETAGPLTRAENLETREQLSERFVALSPEHRRVIGLRQFEGASARETARRMGRSEPAVHSLYRRALLAWREGLPEESRD